MVATLTIRVATLKKKKKSERKRERTLTLRSVMESFRDYLEMLNIDAILAYYILDF